MKAIKSKLTQKEQVFSEEEFAELARTSWWQKNFKKFTLTDLRGRPVVNTEIPKDVKKIKIKNNEG